MDKKELKKLVEEILEQVYSAKYGTKNRVELIQRLENVLKLLSK